MNIRRRPLPSPRTTRFGGGLPAIFIALILLSLLLPVPAHAQETGDTLHVPPDQQVQGNLATTGRDILVDGEVLGDVTSWSGQITINGHVHGDVVSYGGSITLGAAAQVDGHVLALSGQVAQPDSAQVAGRVIGSEATAGTGAVASLVNLFGNGQSDMPGSLPRSLLSVIMALFVLLLAGISAWRWPRRTEGAGRTLLSMPWRSLLLGLLTTLLVAAFLLPLSALLAMTLVGLPLILALLLLLQLPYIYGLATLAQVAGRRLLRISRYGQSGQATLVGTLLLLLPLTLLGILTPAGSAILFYTLASAGLGAVILSRGGAFVPVRGQETHQS